MLPVHTFEGTTPGTKKGAACSCKRRGIQLCKNECDRKESTLFYATASSLS